MVTDKDSKAFAAVTAEGDGDDDEGRLGRHGTLLERSRSAHIPVSRGKSWADGDGRHISVHSLVQFTLHRSTGDTCFARWWRECC